MNEQQIATFKTQLNSSARKLREEIRNELLRSENESYIEIAGSIHDAGEESVADLLSDQNIAAIDRQINELRGVEAALQRIAMGSYGICENCGATIPIERLRVQPAAARCVACQVRVENDATAARIHTL